MLKLHTPNELRTNGMERNIWHHIDCIYEPNIFLVRVNTEKVFVVSNIYVFTI